MLYRLAFKYMFFDRLKIQLNFIMSGDNLISNLLIKYTGEMTETKKIVYLDRKFRELDEFIEKIPEAA